MVYDNPEIVGGITKELYPTLAGKFDTTVSRVERAIRHAIEVSWNRGDWDLMEEIFGHSVDIDKAYSDLVSAVKNLNQLILSLLLQ